MLHSHVRLLILAVATLAASTTAAASLTKRMTSGILVKSPEDYPFMAAWRDFYDDAGGSHKRFCAAAVVSDRHILTSSICLYNATSKSIITDGVDIQAGSLNPESGQEYHMSKIYWPGMLGDQFLPENFSKQYVSILVNPAFQLSKTIQPIKISTVPVKDDEQLTIVGWGSDGSTAEWRTTLATGSAQVVSDTVCKTAWNKAIPDHPWLNREDGEYFCTSGSTICPGDNGSLLVRKEHRGYSLVGIGAIKININGTNTGCNVNGSLSYWMRPAAFIDELAVWMGVGRDAIVFNNTEEAVPPPIVNAEYPQLPIGKIVGIVAGVIAFIVLVVGAIWYIRRRKRVEYDDDQNRYSLVSTADPKNLYILGSADQVDPFATVYQNAGQVQTIHPVYIATDVFQQPLAAIHSPLYATVSPAVDQVTIATAASPMSGFSDNASSQLQQQHQQYVTLQQVDQHVFAPAVSEPAQQIGESTTVANAASPRADAQTHA